MQIVGCDFHPSFQQIAVLDTVTGEIEERRLVHSDGEAEAFYGELDAPALIGMEAVGNSLWFEQLVTRQRPSSSKRGSIAIKQAGCVSAPARNRSNTSHR